MIAISPVRDLRNFVRDDRLTPIPHNLQYRPVVQAEPDHDAFCCLVFGHRRHVCRHPDAARLPVERVERAVIGGSRAVLIARVCIRGPSP